jgi:coproporphyrinogen III oxidase-like Fe-S oxidoreductase
MMNALRLNGGFPLALFTERTGLPLAAIEKSALAARREGLLEAADGWLRPTLQGRRFLNRLLAGFLAEDRSLTARVLCHHTARQTTDKDAAA